MLTNVQKSPIRNGEENENVILNQHADPDHHRKLVTSKSHHPVPMPIPSLVDVRFRVRQLSCLQMDRMTERSHNLRLVGGGNNKRRLITTRELAERRHDSEIDPKLW